MCVCVCVCVYIEVIKALLKKYIMFTIVNKLYLK